MTALDAEHDPAAPSSDAEREASEGSEGKPRPGARRVSREQLVLLVTIPALVAVVLGGWVAWRLTAELDAVEARQLAWGAIWRLTREHVLISVVTTLVVLVIALPLGVALTRKPLRRAAPLVVGIANAGQAAPAIGLIVLFAIWLGFGFTTGVVALTLYGLLPVLRNTIVGLEGVDATLVEAGRGMGMSAAAVLFRIELPLAVPVIMAGVRTALVLVVGTATFATFIDAGGLGALIQTGITLYRTSIVVSGALLVASLALLIDWLGRILESVVRPKGV